MNEEINKIIANLEGCVGIFDCLLTPVESNLLVLYIKELQQKNKNLEQALDNIKKICNSIPEEHSICDVGKIHDIEVIIQKTKGDVENENNNV